MSGRLNHAKAKADIKARVHGERLPTAPTALRGWRTEWDGPEFPVTVTYCATVTTITPRQGKRNPTANPAATFTTTPTTSGETLRRAS